MNKKSASSVCGINVNHFDRDELAKEMLMDVRQKCRGKLVFSLNGESLAKYHCDYSFRKLLKQADLIHPDGESIVRFGNLLNSKGTFKERVATTDFFHDAAEVAQREGLSFYLLGASNVEINDAVINIKSLYPNLNIAGYNDGYFSEEDTVEILKDINSSKADILWLGLGRPKQEEWAIKYRSELSTVAWIKTCGGLFDFISGKNKRAPEIMQKLGLEWLYRLSLEPKRLGYRYITTNVISVLVFARCYVKKVLGL